MSRASAWVIPPPPPHVHTLEKTFVVTGASADAAVPSSNHGFSLQPCCSSLSCGRGLHLQRALASEHGSRQGPGVAAGRSGRKLAEGKVMAGKTRFWNSFSTTSPTPFVPASVPPHVLSLCRQQSVLHDEMSGRIPSLARFPAQQEEHLHPHKAERHGRAAASR